MFRLTFQNVPLLSSCAKQDYLARIFRFSTCERHLGPNLHESNVRIVEYLKNPYHTKISRGVQTDLGVRASIRIAC